MNRSLSGPTTPVTPATSATTPRREPAVVRDVTGVPWRVFDTRDPVADVTRTRTRLGARGARFRVFVAPDGRRRVYAFEEREARATQPASLARQFDAAEPVAEDRARDQDSSITSR